MKDLLHGTVQVFVALDRDYRSKDQVHRVKTKLAAIGVHAHIWRRKELESYLIEADVIARVLGLEVSEVHMRVDAVTAGMCDAVAQAMAHERARVAPAAERARVRARVESDIAGMWADSGRRLTLCPPKEVLASLNRELEREGRKAVSFQRLAREMRSDEVPDEVKAFLLKVDETVLG